MKKISLLLTFVLLMFSLAAVGQSSSEPAPAQQPSAQSPTSDMNGNIMEGCVVQVEKDFYLEPVNGGNRLRLRGNHDFAADVGHRVRAEGTVGAPGTSLGGNTGGNHPDSADHPSDNKPSSSPSGTSGEGAHTSSSTNSTTQDFLATRVTTVSETCPSHAGSSGGSVTNPH
jgi:hypothetical protein